MKKKNIGNKEKVYKSIDLLSQEMAKVFIKNNRAKLISEIENDINKKRQINSNSKVSNNNNSSDIPSNDMSMNSSQQCRSRNSLNSKNSKISQISENSKLIKKSRSNKSINVSSNIKNKKKGYQRTIQSMKNASHKRKTNFSISEQRPKKVSFALKNSNIRNSDYIKSISDINAKMIKFNEKNEEKELNILSPIYHKRGENNEINETFGNNDALLKSISSNKYYK